ncbi:MAG: hypothetical protein L7F78_09580 [Syntrophales bacterium LBB04]|nr:hypothetical protein [Syntrophales bacterium LBB04]
MGKKVVILLCALIVATLIGCGSSSSWKKPDRTYTMANASYDISLSSVERSIGAEKIHQDQRIEAVPEDGISAYYFEDEMARIKWRPASADIGFVINNKADRPVKIVWDEAQFIDEKGVSHRVIHSGIGYEERNGSHPPTIIDARGTLEDFVHPADYFKREELSGGKSYKQQGYWKRAPFLPTQIKGTAEELRKRAEPFAGKTFQVILALQIDDVRNDYVYTFRINKVDVTEKEQQQEKNPNEGKGSGKGGRRRAN